MKYFLTFSMSLLLACYTLAATRSITTLETSRIHASELVPVLKPHLSSGSTITAYQNRLVLNATPDEVQRIKVILQQLDGAGGRQLMIAVKVGDNQQQVEQSWQVEPEVRITKNGKLQTETHVTARVQRRVVGTQGSSQQGVRATEGQRTFIVAGQQIPFNSRTASGGTAQSWKAANQGFYATAQLQGGSVSIDLAQQDQQDQQGSAAGVSGLQLQTRVNGTLDQWILVGYIYQQNTLQTEHGIITQGQRTQVKGRSTPVYLKVTVAQ